MIEWMLRAFFPAYAAPVATALRIEQKLAALDGGKLFEHVLEVFASEGLDLSQLLSRGGLDLRHIEDVQTALNALVLEPAGNHLLTVDGVQDFSEKGAFRQAVMDFQRNNHMDVDGWAGPTTIAAMRKALAAAGVSVK
jgi:hypothetical protein